MKPSDPFHRRLRPARLRSTAFSTPASPHRVQSKSRAMTTVQPWSQRSASATAASPLAVATRSVPRGAEPALGSSATRRPRRRCRPTGCRARVPPWPRCGRFTWNQSARPSVGDRVRRPTGCRARLSPCPPSGRSTWNWSGRSALYSSPTDDAEPVRSARVSRRTLDDCHSVRLRRRPALLITAPVGTGHARPHRRDSPARGDRHRAGAQSWSRHPRHCPHRGWIRVLRGSTAFHVEQSAADTLRPT